MGAPRPPSRPPSAPRFADLASLAAARCGGLPRIRKLSERNARQGFFEHDEYERVITHLPDYLEDACRFAYLSGWRRGEVFALEWTDVD
ncbi:MAG TPA: hypothetical protein VEK79_14390 [Thermoanaerobaculia bacterium]|nr:hypothetical protein [Thermoanaerobaculia bacterium]